MKAISLPTLFRETAKQYSELTAINFLGKRISFQEIDQLTENIAYNLTNRGIIKGDRVALYCINSDSFAIAYMGILKAGGVVIPLNLLQTPVEISYIMNDAGVKSLIHHETFDNAVEAARNNIPSLETVIRISASKNSKDDDFNTILQQNNRASEIDIDPQNDLAAILYTSGTTGKPKGAMLTHANLASNTDSVVKSIKVIPGKDILVAVLPMFHAFAATAAMLTPMLRGLTMLPIMKFEPELLANTIQASGASVLFAVPSMYNVLLNMSDEQVAKLSSLRFCVSGGAAMPEEIMKRFEEKFGILIYEGYGPTECSPVTNVNPIGGKRKALSVGLPVEHVKLCIKDGEGNNLPNGEVGEICVQGPNVMKGYWNRPEATAESFFGDWFRTGDLGKKDDEGYYYIVDRMKDMIIVNGMNVYPRIVEEVLYQHPDIAECAVIGIDDNLHGEIVAAYIATTSGKELSASDLRVFCRDKLGRYQIPRKYFFVDALPKNATGKILKRELKGQHKLETA